MSQYTKNELWKIFETLPAELKQAVFSEETADSIREICQRNSVAEDQIGLVAGIVGDCLMGLLHPEDIAQTLVNDLSINIEKAHNISREINRLILFPVKSYLYDFYKEITFVPSGKIVQSEMVRPHKTASVPSAKPTPPKPTARPTARPKAPDAYREKIE